MSLPELLESYSPSFLALLEKRGLAEPAARRRFLAPDLNNLYDPFLMAGMESACLRLKQAKERGESVFVHGDYDVDGITGAAILARTFELFGLKAKIFLPERGRDGYGVSEEAVVEAAQNGFKLLVTVDCGVTARRQIEAAAVHGMQTIILDHHRIPADGLPPACAILNPQREDCQYPFKELSAGGLAFKLAQALLGEEALKFLDLTAISTVCDVAPLTDENRILVRHGLLKLGADSSCGLKALSRVSGIRTRSFNTGHLGFMIGPRINAAGRMSSPDTALRLLLTENEREAESLARALDEENKSRQQEERVMVQEALSEAERTFHFNRDRVVVVARRGWHPGIVGIVAARLVDKYHRPAVVIALKDGVGKGSGRSIKGFHLFNAMGAAKEHLSEFGGHELAAGLSIQEEKVADFRQAMNDFARENVAADIFVKKTKHELEISLGALTEVFLAELALLEPYGAGNPRPVFKSTGLQVRGAARKKTPRAFQFLVTDGRVTYEASWNSDNTRAPEWMADRQKLDLFYTVKTFSLSGMEMATLEVKEALPL
ncbi:MAG: single-stranded-DNA-specific exonuclease RecJ [Omnitrophica bacterium GWA2_52_12]|nr:MAG: single-stranded-DNA-specific exonuclease RecJ [Omnitrophica bacterium GWA2_52_12]